MPGRRLAAGARAAGRGVARGFHHAKATVVAVRAAVPLHPAGAEEASAMALDPALQALQLLSAEQKTKGRAEVGGAEVYGAVVQNSQLSALEQASVGTSIARMAMARQGDWFAPDTKPSFWRSVRGHLGLLGPDRHGASQ